jgi:hypothetical protein
MAKFHAHFERKNKSREETAPRNRINPRLSPRRTELVEVKRTGQDERLRS